MERCRDEDFHQKGNQQDVYSRDTEASWCHVALKSHNTCTNQLVSSTVFGCLFLSFSTGSSEQKLKKNL